ncbi:MAG: hypothetical protein J5895_04090 [Alphaproteobacteria bacterium]|nr:hypothetical protein [Alphaproteobacteria bacterium]
MQSQNEYIGDDKFKKFLAHYNCPTPLDVVKMRFAGAICSPNKNLRPTDVIASFFENGQGPRLETKGEAELFFKFFMGLWDEMFALIGFNKLKLPKETSKNIAEVALNRYMVLEAGFLEGFWGGLENLNIPTYLAEVLDSLSDLAEVYQIVAKRAQKGENPETLRQVLKNADEMAQKTLSFIVENFALSKIRQIH